MVIKKERISELHWVLSMVASRLYWSRKSRRIWVINTLTASGAALIDARRRTNLHWEIWSKTKDTKTDGISLPGIIPLIGYIAKLMKLPLGHNALTNYLNTKCLLKTYQIFRNQKDDSVRSSNTSSNHFS